MGSKIQHILLYKSESESEMKLKIREDLTLKSNFFWNPKKLLYQLAILTSSCRFHKSSKKLHVIHFIVCPMITHLFHSVSHDYTLNAI